MPRTKEQLEAAATAAEEWLDSLDPHATAAEDPTDLRRIGVGLAQIATAENELADAVAAARTAGRSWGQIALVLGTSRQAAQKRYSKIPKVA